MCPKAIGGAWGLAALLLGSQAHAQFRDGQSPVVVPGARPMPAPASDVAAPFLDAYVRAGRPRVVLMWNRQFSESAQTDYVDKTITRDTGKTSTNSLEKTSRGPTDTATLKDASAEKDDTRTVTSGKVVVNEASRPTKLPERVALMIEKAFVYEMTRGGVLFVDRAVVMRTTAAARHRSGGDPRLIETDALLDNSDLLLEILLVEDRDAPAGYAFDVRAKRLKDGISLVSMYTQAFPPAPPQREGRWTGTDNGYEYQTPPAPLPPSPPQVGAALARDVMTSLQARLQPVPSARR
jgi:hypothetical protein